MEQAVQMAIGNNMCVHQLSGVEWSSSESVKAKLLALFVTLSKNAVLEMRKGTLNQWDRVDG